MVRLHGPLLDLHDDEIFDVALAEDRVDRLRDLDAVAVARSTRLFPRGTVPPTRLSAWDSGSGSAATSADMVVRLRRRSRRVIHRIFLRRYALT
jgi:hypothetical protein